MTRKRIGILGAGAIGSAVAKAVLQNAALELTYVYSRSDKRFADLPAGVGTTSLPDVLSRATDLVIEAAHAEVLRDVGIRLVRKSDLMVYSVTALADDVFRLALDDMARKAGHNLFIPHGALIGTDGLLDAGPTLEAVTITTTKSPASLGLPPQEFKIVYEGPTRGACEKFPRNVNVHATLALAGLGFDRTISRIVADPKVSTNAHLVEIGGAGYQFKIQISSHAGGKVSGAYMLQSAVGALRRVCNRSGGMQFV